MKTFVIYYYDECQSFNAFMNLAKNKDAAIDDFNNFARDKKISAKITQVQELKEI